MEVHGKEGVDGSSPSENGRDIEPGVAERDQYVLSCRIYRTDSGLTASRTNSGCVRR
jgi:hypothetical protein